MQRLDEKIEWQRHPTERSSMIAVAGSSDRLYVRRERKGSRAFIGFINEREVAYGGNQQEAMTKTAKEWRSRRYANAAPEDSTNITWTREEMREFDRITNMLSSPRQMDRLNARLDLLPKFIEKHGKEKCDAMFEKLLEKDRRRG